MMHFFLFTLQFTVLSAYNAHSPIHRSYRDTVTLSALLIGLLPLVGMYLPTYIVQPFNSSFTTTIRLASVIKFYAIRTEQFHRIWKLVGSLICSTRLPKSLFNASIRAWLSAGRVGVWLPNWGTFIGT